MHLPMFVMRSIYNHNGASLRQKVENFLASKMIVALLYIWMAVKNCDIIIVNHILICELNNDF